MSGVLRTACIALVFVFVLSVPTQTARSQPGGPGEIPPFPCDYGLEYCEKEVCERTCIKWEYVRRTGSHIRVKVCVQHQTTCYTIWEPCGGWPEGCGPGSW